MTRLRPPLSVSSAIATITLLLGSSFRVQACLFHNGSLHPGGTTHQANAFRNPSDRASGDSKQQTLLDYGDVASFGAVVGLFAIAIRYKTRYAHTAPDAVDVLSKHPQLEHPEMILTIVPKEALSSTVDTDFFVGR